MPDTPNLDPAARDVLDDGGLVLDAVPAGDPEDTEWAPARWRQSHRRSLAPVAVAAPTCSIRRPKASPPRPLRHATARLSRCAPGAQREWRAVGGNSRIREGV